MHVLSHVSKCVCSKTLQSRLASTVWFLPVDRNSWFLRTFDDVCVLFVCACQTVCKISSEKPQKTYQDFQTFYCQKPCLFKVRLPHATNFQKNSWIISQLLMKARYHQSDQKDSHCLTQNIWPLFLWKFMGSKLFLCHRFLTLKPLGYHIHRAKERYKFSILGSS